jgi:predicted SnoaL-like aldol condensation-catalyzing enzyme
MDHAVMSTHKDAAVSFLKLAASGRVREAYGQYTASHFRHHNPFFAAGADALKKAMEENAQQNPDKKLEVHHVIEEGDLVTVHSHVQMKPGDRGAALAHIFRFEGDRIAELWDIGQPVPADTINADGVF